MWVAGGVARKLCVVSISGSSVEEQKAMYEGFVVDEFLTKPSRKTDLLAALARCAAKAQSAH
jgi:hypothetical protein